MSLFKPLRTVLRSKRFINIANQTSNYSLQALYLPKKVILNKNIPFERHAIINKIITSHCFSKKCGSVKIEHLADLILTENFTYREFNKKGEIIKILEFLVSHGCKLSDIKKKCLNILTPSNSSFSKFQQIAELGTDVLELIPFINLSLPSLRKAAQQAKEDKNEIAVFPNRILYLSHHLETPVEKLIPVLAKHSSLLTMPFNRLEHKINVLKNAEISSEDLVKDLWIFNYNEKLLANRISAAEKADVKLKPWMLRCSDKFFNSRLNKDTETQRILEGNDIVIYMSKKLDCNEKYVEYMMERNKLLRNINIPKIEQIIHFLYEKGYTPQEVRLFPRVFCSKIETLERRFDEYQQVRNTLPSISQLCIDSKKFQTRMGKYDKSVESVSTT